MHEGQVTPTPSVASALVGSAAALFDLSHGFPRTYPRPKPASRGRWLVRHYHASVYDRMALAGQRPAPEMLNRQERRRRWGSDCDFRSAIDAMTQMPAPLSEPDPLFEDNRDLVWFEHYGAAAARNRRKAARRAVRAAGGQA
jgi:hypothetical protein